MDFLIADLTSSSEGSISAPANPLPSETTTRDIRNLSRILISLSGGKR